MAETVHQEPSTTAAQPQEERTFTQSEMNAIIQDRLNRERGKYADYEALKEKAAQFDAAQEAGKTELQKATEKVSRLQAQLDAMTQADTVRQVREGVSRKTGVPAALLSGATEEECTAQAQAILQFANPGGYPNVKTHRINPRTVCGVGTERFQVISCKGDSLWLFLLIVPIPSPCLPQFPPKSGRRRRALPLSCRWHGASRCPALA